MSDLRDDSYENVAFDFDDENSLLSIGEHFPRFNKKCVVSIKDGEEFKNMELKDLLSKWTVMFWWPKDFTFVCPTEIESFNEKFEEFKKRNTNLIGASTDSEFVHLAWRKNHAGLKDLKFPMLADTSKSLAQRLGILEKEEKIAYRATFIINPQGVIKWVCVNDLPVGRNVDEVIRVLDALQNGGLTPCNWRKGDKTL